VKQSTGVLVTTSTSTVGPLDPNTGGGLYG
ncbi:uncharacterized protein METZ01_LOCUS204245, partial [marine metagenome]